MKDGLGGKGTESQRPLQHSSTSIFLMSDQDHQSDVHAHIISSPNTPPIQLPPQTETMAKEWPNLLNIIIMPPPPQTQHRESFQAQPNPTPLNSSKKNSGSELQNRKLTSLIMFEQAQAQVQACKLNVTYRQTGARNSYLLLHLLPSPVEADERRYCPFPQTRHAGQSSNTNSSVQSC